jgi:hypothetical protein
MTYHGWVSHDPETFALPEEQPTSQPLDLDAIRDRYETAARIPHGTNVAEASFRDVPVLIAEVERLRAENRRMNIGSSGYPCPAEDCNDGVTAEYADGFAYCTVCDGAGWVSHTEETPT